MDQISHEPYNSVILIGTPLETLVGMQCTLSSGNVTRYVRRCTQEATVVIVAKCPECSGGGIIPACRPHGKQMVAMRGDGVCPECGALMKISEPVDLPTPKEDKPAPQRAALDDDWSDLYEM